MSFRLQKRIHLFKGVTLNLSKSGTSWTLGRRGASVSTKDGNTTGNIGIPGTGCLIGNGSPGRLPAGLVRLSGNHPGGRGRVGVRLAARDADLA